ncbi:GNAT family N-acetyltransferase [Methanogenium organophilum]|uniref:GNAT family N-acetyltransferase n=1 Tax=Methanogenium organophilum TaxID=2199 RepID=A0A9X9S1X5_METOG|nr:GNAT family N-acetyltransferase [Methanogenium organophilum]WAI00348.1 GNAT family N-acetyltransferase [Methanogenium organophilum]
METTDSDLIRLPKDRIVAASEMLVRSFFDDPKLTYILPDGDSRTEKGRHLFAFELRYGLRYGQVYATSPNLEGVATWIPSEKAAITFWRAIFCGGMALQRGLGKETMDRLMTFSEKVDIYHKKHLPGPHCYLFFIGVDPRHQGQGYGGRLIRPMLEWLDNNRMACYLNTQNEENIGLYEHFGFRVVEQVTLPGSGIVHTGMIRKPVVEEERIFEDEPVDE